MADEPFQASYRRHRPRRFAEIRGQDHVITALRNAVQGERVAHAYLFSGPRGTGKTSTARILAAALNCASPVEGEPDGTCESCVAIRAGVSLDVMELDAASNNGVDAMRDLVTRAALGSPGRWKVYIVDEVHMLTTGASNALLKTLEEPPGHVIFVLATTDDQKVLPTIRSRTQHFHFRLLAPETLSGLIAEVNEQDDLGLDPRTLDRVVQRGAGSARDALSALDQAAAAGVAEDESDAVPTIVEAMVARDGGAALVAVAEAARRGRDPHRLAVEVVQHLRSGFLLLMAPEISDTLEHERAAVEDRAHRLGAPALVRAMEILGETLVEMRESLDSRVTLELALIRICAPVADTSPAALLERLEILERRTAQGGAARPDGAAPAAPAAPLTGARPAAPTATPPTASAPTGPSATAPTGPSAAAPTGPTTARPAAAPPGPSCPEPTPPPLRRPPPGEGMPPRGGPGDEPPPRVRAEPRPGGAPTIGALRQRAAAPGGPPSATGGPAPDPAGPATAGPPPAIDRDELTKRWGDAIFPGLAARAKAAFRPGRWGRVESGTAVFILPPEMFGPAEQNRADVEAALQSALGGPITVRLEAEGGDSGPVGRTDRGAPPEPRRSPPPPPPPAESEAMSRAEFAELEMAPEPALSAEARLMEAFPGTTEELS